MSRQGASTEELENFRNGLIEQRAKYKSLQSWTNHCSDLVKLLEKQGTLKNNQLKGELSEIVLEQYLLLIQKALLLKGVKSTIIKNLGMIHRSEYNDKLYSSEVDLCLITEYKCYLFEVKSYSGDKVLSKECYLKGRSTIDIYGQSKTHLDFFEMLFDDCRIKYLNRNGKMPSPYKLLFFEFSSSVIKDNRDKKWKEIIPYLNTSNILTWFGTNQLVFDKKQWDLNKVNKRFKELNENRELIMQYHVDRLQNKNK